MSNGEVKLIDFGESKDYIYDPEDESKNTYTVRRSVHVACFPHSSALILDGDDPRHTSVLITDSMARSRG